MDKITLEVRPARLRKDSETIIIDWIGLAISQHWMIIPRVDGIFMGCDPFMRICIRDTTKEIKIYNPEIHEFEYIEQTLDFLMQGYSPPEIGGIVLSRADITAALRSTNYRPRTKGITLSNEILLLEFNPIMFIYHLTTMRYERTARTQIKDGLAVEQFPTTHIKFKHRDEDYDAVIYADEYTDNHGENIQGEQCGDRYDTLINFHGNPPTEILKLFEAVL